MLNKFFSNDNLKNYKSESYQRKPRRCCIPSGFKPAYGTFIGFQPRILEENALAPLDAVLSAPPVGITFTPGTATVTVLNAGTYRVTYMLISDILSNYGLSINGVFLPNSTFSNKGGSSMTGTATVNLSAASTLGITTSSAVLLTGTNTVLDILRIS